MKTLCFFSSLSLWCFLGFFAVAVWADEPSAGKGVSGYYSLAMLIGVDENSGIVTGWYENSTGWDEHTQAPRFSCSFYLFGKLRGDIYHITTWSPGADDQIDGSLMFFTQDEQPRLRIQLQEEHGGCWNVQHFADEGGAEFGLDQRGDWIAVRVVSAKKAFFHTSPDSQTKRPAYVISGDVLRVFTIQNGWIDAEFGAEKRTRGWLKEADVFPAASSELKPVTLSGERWPLADPLYQTLQ